MNKPVHLLLVEDNEADAEAMSRALAQWQYAYTLTVVHDALTAFEILRRRPTQYQPKPHLILLDLNLPGINGHEFLEELRSDPQLRRVVVFVWTVSESQQDIDACYDKLVAGYVVKTKASNNWENLLELISQYCEMVEFPAS